MMVLSSKYFLAVFIIIAVSELSNAQTSSISDISLTASPPVIRENFTSDASVKCLYRHTNTSQLHSLTSIIVSSTAPGGDEGVFTEVATVALSSPQSVMVKDDMGAQVDGQIVVDGESFVSLKWKYPKQDIMGKFKCEVFGMDNIGHTTVRIATVSISETDVTMDMIFAKMRETDEKLDAAITSLNKVMKDRDDINSRLNKAVTEMDDLKSRINSSRDAMIEYSSTFKEHQYLLSVRVNDYSAFEDSICRLYGGYLAEIDNQDEYNAIHSFIKSHNIRAYVSVGGTDQDHEGTWIYKRTGRPVVFTGGYLPGRPSKETSRNCLHLDFWNSQGKIIDEYCVWSLHNVNNSDLRFLCEIPTL